VDADELTGLLSEILSPEARARITSELDLDFVHAYGDRARFRVHCFHKATGLAAVFHRVPSQVVSLEEAGCPDVVRRIGERRCGLVLCAGPAGSGKSTTLAALVDHLNQIRACHILAVESPVEIVHAPVRAHVVHREVGPDVPSFAAAIRGAAREDVDVLLVGDLAGEETLLAALELALSGALVLGALTCDGAAHAIDAVVHAFREEDRARVRGMLAEALVAVVAQELVHRADGAGLVAAHEILLGSAALASMIRDERSADIPSLMQAGTAVGMQTKDLALERLYQLGLVTAEEALERALDKGSFQKAFTRRTAPIV
jgi:twitching motility protein PilT